MLSILSCACWPSVCLLWRNIYLGVLPSFQLGFLFFLLLSYIRCLCIMEIKPFSVTSFANIFSHSVSRLFILFMVSFAVQKLVSLTRSHLFILVFFFHYSRRWIKKDLSVIYVKECYSYVFL